MLKPLLSLLCMFVFSCLYAQDVKQLLQTSKAKSETIHNGYFEMTKSMKFMDEKDTNRSNSFTFYFERSPGDSIYPSRFHYRHFFNGSYIRNVLYTGSDYLSFSSNDSSGQVMNTSRWASALMKKRHSDLFNFYAPFTGALYSPFPDTAFYNDGKTKFKLLGQVVLNGFNCFHVQMTQYPAYDSTEIYHNVQTTYDYWINRADSILVQYAASSIVKKGNDIFHEYFSWSVTEYVLNKLKPADLEKLQLTSVPSNINLSDYNEKQKHDLIENGKPAPLWHLSSVSGKDYSLAALKGQLVLLDFFYLSCYPCRQSFPMLKEFHEKYNNRGLNVLGINPFDSKEDGIETILAKNGISYPVFLNSQRIADDYRITSYPTIYLIDKTGKIIFSAIGFHQAQAELLEELIKKNLE